MRTTKPLETVGPCRSLLFLQLPQIPVAGDGQRLRRAEAHAVRLAWNDRVMSLIPVQAKVGTVRGRTERPDEAEARYRQAIVAARQAT